MRTYAPRFNGRTSAGGTRKPVKVNGSPQRLFGTSSGRSRVGGIPTPKFNGRKAKGW